MKTQKELNTIKEEVKTLNKKLVELNDDELTQVTGGVGHYFIYYTIDDDSSLPVSDVSGSSVFPVD